MARRIAEDHEYVWRAVVTSHWANGNPYTVYCGTFNRKNHATAAARAAAGSSSVITIQRSKLIWETVETRGEPDEPDQQ